MEFTEKIVEKDEWRDAIELQTDYDVETIIAENLFLENAKKKVAGLQRNKGQHDLRDRQCFLVPFFRSSDGRKDANEAVDR